MSRPSLNVGYQGFVPAARRIPEAMKPGDTRHSLDGKFAAASTNAPEPDLDFDPYKSVAGATMQRSVRRSDYRVPDRRGVMATNDRRAPPPRRFIARSTYQDHFEDFMAVRGPRPPPSRAVSPVRLTVAAPAATPPVLRASPGQGLEVLSRYGEEEYRRAFDALDSDGSGSIERDEVIALFRRVMGCEPPKFAADQFMLLFDRNRVRGRARAWRRAAMRPPNPPFAVQPHRMTACPGTSSKRASSASGGRRRRRCRVGCPCGRSRRG